MTLTVTDSAAQRLGALAEEHGITEEQGLRLFTRSGGCGCSGPSFGMTIDSAQDADQVMLISGVRFIIDPTSADSLEGASIDYIDDVMRQGFTIEAPNAQQGAGCGCGNGGGHGH
jgi:iron-sulfur cluster assembly accessory protein